MGSRPYEGTHDEIISVQVFFSRLQDCVSFLLSHPSSPNTQDRVGGSKKRKKEKSSLWVDIMLPLGFSWLLLACLLAMIAVVPKKESFYLLDGFIIAFAYRSLAWISHGAHKDIDSPDYHGAYYFQVGPSTDLTQQEDSVNQMDNRIPFKTVKSAS